MESNSVFSHALITRKTIPTIMVGIVFLVINAWENRAPSNTRSELLSVMEYNNHQFLARASYFHVPLCGMVINKCACALQHKHPSITTI